MASLSIRDIDDDVRDRLRQRAARNGRSMESEARRILTDAVNDPQRELGLGVALIEAFDRIGGVDLDIPPRTDQPRAPDFS